MKQTQLKPVTLAEQEALGLRHPRRANYLPAAPQRRLELPATTATTYTIDAHPSAQLASVTHTSATDRARGYLMVQAPLAGVVAVLVLAVAKALVNFPLLSFAAFLVFWVSFALVWLLGWSVTLLLSAEGVALFESHKKWQTIQREQAERWRHYNRAQRTPVGDDEQ